MGPQLCYPWLSNGVPTPGWIHGVTVIREVSNLPARQMAVSPPQLSRFRSRFKNRATPVRSTPNEDASQSLPVKCRATIAARTAQA